MNVGDMVCISLKAMLNDNINKLKYGSRIDIDFDGYIRLINNPRGGYLYDGEECKVVEATDEYVRLLNQDGEQDTEFLMTYEELGIAYFAYKQ